MLSFYSLAYLLQQIVSAAPVAALYALLAFGYSLGFGLTRRADFTPGALFAFAGQLFVLFAAFGYERLWLVYPAALALGAAVATAYTLVTARLIGRFVARPLLARSPNALIAASLGLMITLMELARLASGSREQWLSPFLNQHMVVWAMDRFPVVMTDIQLLMSAGIVVVLVSGTWILTKTAIGRRWRAVCDDAGAAELLGIDADGLRMRTQIVTAACMALAGILSTAYYGSMDFGSGLMFGLKVVMIAAIGDHAAPGKSAAGAALFGLAETLWGAYLPYAWRDLAMFSLLVALAVIVRRERRV